MATWNRTSDGWPSHSGAVLCYDTNTRNASVMHYHRQWRPAKTDSWAYLFKYYLRKELPPIEPSWVQFCGNRMKRCVPPTHWQEIDLESLPRIS